MTGAAAVDRFLALGEFFFGSGDTRIRTVLGTCVAITMWHPTRRLGGICHYLLPARGDSARARAAAAGVYAEDVIQLFADELRRSHTRPHDYVVKMFGGGHMFPGQLTEPDCRRQACREERRGACENVGCKNIDAGRRLLALAGYTLVLEDVGGHGSRQVVFDLGSGQVWVRRGDGMRDGMAVAV